VKSYYKHLISRKGFGEIIENTQKPILRSSGIFPVVKNKFYSTRILYLGYWLIKRNIPEVSLLVTLRDQSGNFLSRKSELIDSVKSFSIDLNTLLKEINFNFEHDFLGSIETEFNTTRDMVYPYPALVLEYFNDNFNTCVHTLGRIYNDFEDLNENEQFTVPETGFDISADDDLSPFLAFVNGPLLNSEGTIQYVITNSKSKKFSGVFKLGKINSFETKFLFFNEYIPNLSEILDKKPGSISIKHNFEGFFPRFLVGNIQNSFPSVSFTHSYYDCTLCDADSDFWNRINSDYYDSSIYIPLFLKDNFYTDLVIYPNFSPSDFSIQLILYDKFGNKKFEKLNYLNINSNESKLLKIEFKKLLREFDLDINEITTAQIISNFNKEKIPSRLKFGLNVGISGLRSKLPCNICFNSAPGNPALENKPGSFHWCPIFKNESSVITIANFSTRKDYKKPAKILLNFYHKQDTSFLTREIILDPHAEYRISPNDDELKQFFLDDGWVTIKSDNPFVIGYYFNFHLSGSVAGDHFF
jgi:hypothetical protein